MFAGTESSIDNGSKLLRILQTEICALTGEWMHGMCRIADQCNATPHIIFSVLCTKRKCGEMGSCAEARFYLEECGITRLDGDKDGVPCESLCR